MTESMWIELIKLSIAACFGYMVAAIMCASRDN